MYRIIIKQGESESRMEFDSAKLARLYRDYHLAFGHWNGKSRWIEEKLVTPEMRRFIVDEMTEMRDGKIVRIYRVTDGIEIKMEEAEASSIEECWQLFREARDLYLKASDWTQMADVNISQEARKDYRAYRQYLRDAPKLHGENSIVGAKIYDFTEWKSGKR